MKLFYDNLLADIYGVTDIIKPDREPNNIINANGIKVGNITTHRNDVDTKKNHNDLYMISDIIEEHNNLQTEVNNCKLCRLAESKTNAVFGEGDLNAKIFFVGEGPGADEDLSGRPFVGKAGQLLTKMITAMGLERKNVYIANIVKCRPPGNRNPFDDEANVCIAYLYKQIEIINPEILITLGSVATRYLLGKTDSISSIRGTWQEFKSKLSDRKYKVMPTFHPAYLLRSPLKKRDAWTDLQIVMKEIGLLK